MARFIFSSFGSEVQGTAICSASSCFLVNVMDQVELIEISVVFRASSESQRVTSSHDFLICEEIKKMLLAALSGEFDWYPGGALLELRISNFLRTGNIAHLTFTSRLLLDTAALPMCCQATFGRRRLHLWKQ